MADASVAAAVAETCAAVVGFVLAVKEENVATVQSRFAARELACAAIGRCTAERRLLLHRRGERAELWNLGEQPFIGA